MRWTTALASWSTLAVCGADDAYAATGTSAGSAARAIARNQAVFGDDADQPLAVDHGQRSELCLVHPVGRPLQAVVDVDGEQSRPASVLYSHASLPEGEPALLCGMANHWTARRSLARHHGICR